MPVVELAEVGATGLDSGSAGRAPADLDFACRLAEGVIAVKGSTQVSLPQLPRYRESTTALTGPPAITFPQGTGASGSQTGFLSLVAGDLGNRRHLNLGPVRLGISPSVLEDRMVGVGEMAMRLSALDAVSRHRALDLLTCSLGMCEGSARVPLAKTLFGIREMLRERLASSYVDQRAPKALHIDALFAVDDRSFYVRGWMRDAEAEISSLVAISPEGRTVDLTGRLVRYSRPDVTALYGGDRGQNRLGFLGYFELPVPSILLDGWVFMMFDGAGGSVEAPAPAVSDEPLQVRTALLGDLVYEQMSDRLILQHTFPAVSRLQEKLAASVCIVDVCQYGPPPADPEVSIVVPLYKRIDFVEYQMAQFLHDPDLRSADLIYVLDSPEMAAPLTVLARQMWGLYGISFRVVLLNRNGGFSAANNAGASVARGHRLLLMNSDVMPKKPGWLSRMAAFYAATPGIGALGPKLLYAEGSLQHAGIYFRHSHELGTWLNVHHFQGLSGSFAPANVCRPVHGVTCACLMIDRDLYNSIGGLRGVYVQGDFEDSDICLRLADLGKTNWYLPEVELYHLEGQSYPNEMRRMTFRYNSWLHSLLWGDRIKQLQAFPSDCHSQAAQLNKEGEKI